LHEHKPVSSKTFLLAQPLCQTSADEIPKPKI
jgi:hypothetical protein